MCLAAARKKKCVWRHKPRVFHTWGKKICWSIYVNHNAAHISNPLQTFVLLICYFLSSQGAVIRPVISGDSVKQGICFTPDLFIYPIPAASLSCTYILQQDAEDAKTIQEKQQGKGKAAFKNHSSIYERNLQPCTEVNSVEHSRVHTWEPPSCHILWHGKAERGNIYRQILSSLPKPTVSEVFQEAKCEGSQL